MQDKMWTSIKGAVRALRRVRCVARSRIAMIAAILTGTLAFACAAHADFFRPSTGRWCALTTIGLNDCSYDTFAQCMATLSGVGGVCSENLQAPIYVEPPPPPRRRHRKHHRTPTQ